MTTPLQQAQLRYQGARRGWLTLAATILIVSGVFKIFDAFWAFKYDGELRTELQTVVFEDDLAAWGWVWLVLGLTLIAAGVYALRGARWARWVGIGVASVTAVLVLPWIYFQPFWTLLSAGLALMVIYALVLNNDDEPGVPERYYE